MFFVASADGLPCPKKAFGVSLLTQFLPCRTSFDMTLKEIGAHQPRNVLCAH